MELKTAFKSIATWMQIGKNLFVQILALVLLALFSSSALATPQNPNVVNGDITITQDTNNGIDVLVNQLSEQGIIDWDSFNIGSGEHVHFAQPGSSSVTLNRVTGGSPSEILGNLSATGQVMLLNQAGILFGPNAVVDVAGLIATTADIHNQDFLAGNYMFQQPADGSGRIVNQGLIKVASHGLVALVAPGVTNSGIIKANLGKVILAGLPTGSKYTVDLYGDKLINFMVNDQMAEQFAESDQGVTHSGEIHVDGGKVLITAHAAHKVLDDVINMSGIILADTVKEINGTIILSGGPSGVVNVTGKVLARGNKAGETGGKVIVTGDKVGLFKGAKIDVSGQAGGGTALIGGEYLGESPDSDMNLPVANSTYVDFEAAVFANALASADGGRIIVWGSDSAQVHGNLQAKGGPQGGNGGFVETSGHYLNVEGARVDTSAVNGETGTWLLDPYDITIVDGAVDNNANLAGGIWTATNTPSSISVTSIINSLNISNVTIRTTVGASENGDIIINTTNPTSWLGWTMNNLTLEAYNDIIFQPGAIISRSLFSSGDLILRADSMGRYVQQPGGLFGTVQFNAIPSVNFLGSFGQVHIYENVSNYTTAIDTSAIYVWGLVTRYMLVNDLGGPLGSGRTTGLQYIANDPITLVGKYALTRNLDATNAVQNPDWDDSTDVFTSIAPFVGTFKGDSHDGVAHTISNLTVEQPFIEEIGLLGSVFGGTTPLSFINFSNSSFIGTIESSELNQEIFYAYLVDLFGEGVLNTLDGLAGDLLTGDYADSLFGGDLFGDLGGMQLLQLGDQFLILTNELIDFSFLDDTGWLDDLFDFMQELGGVIDTLQQQLLGTIVVRTEEAVMTIEQLVDNGINEVEGVVADANGETDSSSEYRKMAEAATGDGGGTAAGSVDGATGDKTDPTAMRQSTVIGGLNSVVDLGNKLLGAKNNSPLASRQGLVHDLGDIIRQGKIVVALPAGINNTFVNTDAKGVMHGYSVDSAIELANALGVKVAFNRTVKSTDNIVNLLAENKVDLSINTIPTTSDDAQKILFTEPNIVLEGAMLVNRVWLATAKQELPLIDDPVLEVKNLPLKIGLLKENGLVNSVHGLFPKANLVQYANFVRMIEALQKGDIKAIYADNLIIGQAIFKHPSLGLFNEELLLDDKKSSLSLAAAPGEWKMWQWLNQYLEIKGQTNLKAKRLINYKNKY